MASGAALLERMRRSPHGHSARDLERLLTHFGFSKHEGGNHTVYGHELLADGPVVVVPRHRSLRSHVVRKAVRAVDSLKARQRPTAQEPEDGNEDT